MSTGTRPAKKGATNRRPAPPARSGDARRRQRRRLLVRAGVIGAAAIVVLFLIARGGDDGGSGASGGPPFAVGEPGPGAVAPDFTLPSTAGGEFTLADQRGKTVLLYFQEGLGCQPCWDQIRDMEQAWAEFRSLGIDELVAIAGNPLDQLGQKAADEDIATPVLADPDLSLGDAYGANQYGMMGTSAYGHSFIVVGPDGKIRWRADYGGAPDYTMYVRPPALLADLRAGLGQGTAGS